MCWRMKDTDRLLNEAAKKRRKAAAEKKQAQ
jgi:hypothetical protein